MQWHTFLILHLVARNYQYTNNDAAHHNLPFLFCKTKDPKNEKCSKSRQYPEHHFPLILWQLRMVRPFGPCKVSQRVKESQTIKVFGGAPTL